jgi:hypothetical protein
MKNTLYICTALALLIIAGSVFYYLIIYLPKQKTSYEQFKEDVGTFNWTPPKYEKTNNNFLKVFYP